MFRPGKIISWNILGEVEVVVRFTTLRYFYSKKYIVVITGFLTVKALSCNQLFVTTNVSISKE